MTSTVQIAHARRRNILIVVAIEHGQKSRNRRRHEEEAILCYCVRVKHAHLLSANAILHLLVVTVERAQVEVAIGFVDDRIIVRSAEERVDDDDRESQL